MSNDFEQPTSAEQPSILDIINSELQKLGSKGRWLSAPEFLPEYEVLKGKRILMVEDVIGLIENNLPEFIVATGGNASFLHHTEESTGGLVNKILATNPDIVLMDYNLANEIKGSNVTKILLNSDYRGKVVGFSSENRDREFKEAGAIGSITKGGLETSDSVKELAGLLSK